MSDHSHQLIDHFGWGFSLYKKFVVKAEIGDICRPVGERGHSSAQSSIPDTVGGTHPNVVHECHPADFNIGLPLQEQASGSLSARESSQVRPARMFVIALLH